MNGSNALQIADPNADNPLAQAPSWADAAQSVAGTVSSGVDALGQWLAAQRAKSAQMGLWDDTTGRPTAAGIANAGQQYGNALLAGTVGPKLAARETIPLYGTTNMRINPSTPEMSRLLDQHGGLRVIRNGENMAVAPAYDTTHDEMLSALQSSAHPLGSPHSDAWSIYPDGQVFDAKASDADLLNGVDPSQWPTSLRRLYAQ